MLKTSLIAVVCLLMTAPLANAQVVKGAEAFVGYTNLQSEGLPETNDPSWSAFDVPFFKKRTTLHGINGSFSGYFSSGFGLIGDVSWARRGHSGMFDGEQRSRHIDTSYFVGGPTLKFTRTDRWQPFARILAGVARTSFEAQTTTSQPVGTSSQEFNVASTDFTASAGGGVDIQLGESTKLRLFQVDWMPIFLSDRSVQILGSSGVLQPANLENQRQDNWRFSIGLVF